jgi:hypothetical protein
LLVPACVEWIQFHDISVRPLGPWTRRELERWWSRQGGNPVRIEDLKRLTGGWPWALGELARRAGEARVSIPAALDALMVEAVDMEVRANLLGLPWPARPAFAFAWGDEAETSRAALMERVGERPIPDVELDWQTWEALGWIQTDEAGRAYLNPWVQEMLGSWE